MARKPIEQQIAQLEPRAKTLKARLAKQDRARDTRRKILTRKYGLVRGDAVMWHETGRAKNGSCPHP